MKNYIALLSILCISCFVIASEPIAGSAECNDSGQLARIKQCVARCPGSESRPGQSRTFMPGCKRQAATDIGALADQVYCIQDCFRS